MAADKDVQKDLEALRADIAALTETVGRLASDTAHVRAAMKQTVGAAAREAADIGEQFVADAAKLGSDAAGAAADAGKAAMASLETEIRRNPISAVLTALGIGFVLGVIGRR
jgi:ElaB/YqjD/DUF883 family membrane-anchored ribosome-binding protein